ncbi:MAG: adenylyl-sulfate kinase, partial [Verrucomicrobia bacterium]|nr:adenylyl-sulfate kinase [Verrucomicrobiota bacterium]
MNSSSLPLHIITVGHVDHGKSTLLGRLLHDTDSLSDEQKKMLELAALDGKGMELAFLFDAFLEEQTQNITIDTTQLVFRTPQRSYVMIDAPGHEEFLKNMIAGVTRADAALLLIDVVHGIQAQTKKHLHLLSLMGIDQVIVILNKMDLIDREESFFSRRAQEIKILFQQQGLLPQEIIPIVARTGENIVTRSDKMPWYHGSTVLEALEKMKPNSTLQEKPLRLMVQDVYRVDERRLIVGRVESGVLHIGEEIIFWPGRKKSRISSIEEWRSKEQPRSALAGESVAICLEDPLFIERGHIGSSQEAPPCEGRDISAKIFWVDREPLSQKISIILQLGTERSEGRVSHIIHANPHSLMQHDIAEVKIHLTRPLIYDCYHEIAPTGRFAIISQERLAGGGVILSSQKNITADHSIKSDHLTWSVSPVDRKMRQKQLGHPGMVIWLTGLSGSGKSTLAKGLESLLHQQGIATMILDGDNLRHGLCADLGFSLEDRSENIRRTGEVAKLFAEAG